MSIMINDLRAFVAFISHGSLSRAAAHMHLTQPAMTRRIQRLEAAIGGDLLDRSVKPARVSALGTRVHERAKMVLRDIDGLRELTSETGEPEGLLRIGAVQSISETTAVPAVTLLKRSFPKLRIEMQSDWSKSLIDKVHIGQLDAAAIMLQLPHQFPEEIAAERIGTHRAVIVASRTLPFKRKTLFRELAAYPWVAYPEGGCICRAALLREFQARGLDFNVSVTDYGVERQLGFVAAKAGLGFVSEIMVKSSRYRDKLRVVKVQDFQFSFGIWMIRQRSLGKLTRPVNLFSELVHAHFGDTKD